MTIQIPRITSDAALDFGRSALRRFAPEPRSGLGGAFRSVLNGARAALGAAESLSGHGISQEYIDLIDRQIEVQKQLQLVSFHSNIEKSRHETEMAAVRNIRTA